MSEQKYILNCPKCGRVEGFLPDANEGYDQASATAETVIEEEVVHTPEGVTTRLRCPQCGSWVRPDQVGPA